MEAWLLFATEARGGEARRLREVGEPSFGAHAKRLSLLLEGQDSNQLRESAELGAERAYDILWKEKRLDRSVDLTFRVDGEEPRLVLGHSCDLAFALAFVVVTLSSDKGLVFPALAASGLLDASGGVKPVEGLPGKLDAVLRVMSQGGLIFYPSANDREIAPEVRLQARARNIELRPVERLDEAIEALGVRLERVYLDSPFRGLEAFEYRHRSIFFGRRAESEALVARLIERDQAGRPGVLVIGASGSGKSSFVQAGVLPELEHWAGRSNTGLDWTLWRPREAGVAGASEPMLVASILQSWRGVPDLTRLVEQTTLGALADAYAQVWPAARKFVWVIDQLEELFTLGFDADLVDRFADLLHALQQRGAWVLGTLRADFYQEYQGHATLVAAFAGEGLFDLPALASENLRQVIETPAEAASYGFEVNGFGVSLATRLLKEAQDGTDPLPLLQLVLSELYRHRDEGRRLLTWDAYRKIGGDSKEGLKGAVGKHAETHFSRLPKEVQAALPRLLRALVTIGPKSAPIARPVERAHVTRDDAPTHQLVDALLDSQVRLLVAEGDAAVTRIRVAHEAVFTHWVRARDFIDKNRSDMQLRDHLAVVAKLWRDGKHADRLLPAGLPLAEARDLLVRWGDELDDIVDFVRASSRRSQRKALREIILWAVAGAAVPIGTLIMAAQFAWATCTELVPVGGEGFRDGPNVRECELGGISAFKWQYEQDKDACNDCRNRAFVRLADDSMGARWREYYMHRSPDNQIAWNSGHTWRVESQWINIQHLQEGFMLRRDDKVDPVKARDNGTHVIEFLIPSDPDTGCDQSGLPINSAASRSSARTPPDQSRCIRAPNILRMRWTTLDANGTTVAPTKWKDLSTIQDVARDEVTAPRRARRAFLDALRGVAVTSSSDRAPAQGR